MKELDANDLSAWGKTRAAQFKRPNKAGLFLDNVFTKTILDFGAHQE